VHPTQVFKFSAIFDSIIVISIYNIRLYIFNFGRVVIPLMFMGLLKEIPILL